MKERTKVLIEDPGLAEALGGDRLHAAIRECVAATIHVPRGSWSPEHDLDGFQRFGAELLGEGDLLRPWQREDTATTVPRSGGWRALQPCRLAVLDGGFALRAGRYPEVISGLFGRMLRRSRMLTVTIAIVHHPRVDVRLHMLFWELADRWGTVHPEGVRVPLRLTHTVLADLVAAQRQTVSKALGQLAERGSVTWSDDAWLLAGNPPAELGELGNGALAARHG
jgi:CRP/FNR family transcriptional regulator, cyclic AMP receptor protein